MNYRWLFTLINFVGRGTVCKGRFVAISQSGQYVWTIRAVSRVHGSLLTVPSPVSAIDSQLHHSAFCFFPSSISSSLGRTIGSWARTANKRKHPKKTLTNEQYATFEQGKATKRETNGTHLCTEYQPYDYHIYLQTVCTHEKCPVLL